MNQGLTIPYPFPFHWFALETGECCHQFSDVIDYKIHYWLHLMPWQPIQVCYVLSLYDYASIFFYLYALVDILTTCIKNHKNLYWQP
jgi:hypothetical protein